LLAVLFLAIANLAAAAAEPAPPSVDYLAEARPTIEAANADWIPAMKRKDAKAIASFYMPDGVLVAPNGKAVFGREAVEKFYGERMQAGFRLLSEVERDGKTVHSAGNYLTVWKRSPDGAWQISRNLAM
jgi:ketosteroid isomerase-like protein